MTKDHAQDLLDQLDDLRDRRSIMSPELYRLDSDRLWAELRERDRQQNKYWERRATRMNWKACEAALCEPLPPMARRRIEERLRLLMGREMLKGYEAELVGLSLANLCLYKPDPDDVNRYHGIMDVWELAMSRRCTTVADLAAKLLVSETTCRTYLTAARIEPLVVRQWQAWRRTVTAYYYDPDTYFELRDWMDRREAEAEARRKANVEDKQIAEARRQYERETGFAK